MLERSGYLKRASIVDRSYMGRLRCVGEDATDLLDRLSTNDFSRLSEGHAISTVLTTAKGKVVDWLMVGLCGGQLIVFTSQGSQDPVLKWIEQYTFIEDVTVTDLTEDSSQFTITGDDAKEILLAAGISSPNAQGEILIQEMDGWSLSCWLLPFGRGDRYELLIPCSASDALWNTLVVAGAIPMDQADWEFHRIANGFPVLGAEFGDQTNPLESRLKGSISYNKGCYIGQEVIARLTTYNKVQRRLMAVLVDGAADVGSRLTIDGKSVGHITSSAVNPSGEWAALSMVNIRHATAGKKLLVDGTEMVVELTEPAYALCTEPNEH